MILSRERNAHTEAKDSHMKYSQDPNSCKCLAPPLIQVGKPIVVLFTYVQKGEMKQ